MKYSATFCAFIHRHSLWSSAQADKIITRSILWFALPHRCHARSEAVARHSRSKPGDSSLRSEQAPQSQSEIATPFGLAMTFFCSPGRKLFHAPSNKFSTDPLITTINAIAFIVVILEFHQKSDRFWGGSEERPFQRRPSSHVAGDQGSVWSPGECGLFLVADIRTKRTPGMEATS